ncbi:unnamed protein product [Closterium sp. Yama58-4]|nr:unnamed protein product [Closterium sp. Yama58-4]
MPPKNSRAKPVADAPAGGGDPASKTTPSKGKEVIDNLPSEAEVTAGSSGLTLEEKLKALAMVASDDTFIENDSDEELDIDATKSSYPHLRFTAILLFPVIPSREVASVILTSLLSHVEFATHIMPADPISDNSFAVKVAFRMDTRVKLGPVLWKLPAYMIGRPGVRKIIEAVERQVASNGENFELLISRLNAGLKSYVKEERKRVKATTAHLHEAAAALKLTWMGDPGNDRLKALLDEKESQLRGYQLARQERQHVMAGMNEAVAGEIASPFLSGKIKARREKTQIKELSAGGVTNKAPWSDGLPKELFEEHWDVLGKHFMALVESFTESAELPASTKSAVTILLHKKGGRDAVENYRPITLLSFTYKVLARVVADGMKGVLNEVISPEQYEFMPGRRLSDAVGLVADVIDAAKNGQAD